MGIKFSNKYKPLWTSTANYFILTGGRGSGKSFAVGDFIENLTFQLGHTILFTRYTLTSAAISVIPEFEEKVELENHVGKFDINKADVTNKESGSKILFRGLKTSSGNQTANLKSIQNVTTWVLDEAEELTSETEFDKIDDSIRKKGIQNRVLLILNPTTKEHWIYKRFFEGMGVADDFNGQKGNVQYIHSTYLDNIENLSQKFITKADFLKRTNLNKYNHTLMAAWLDKSEGVVYDNWVWGAFDESLPFGYGQDFGVVDPDAIVRVAIDEKQKYIYADEVLYKGDMGTQTLIDTMSDLIKDKRKLIIADAAEKRLISDIKGAGFNIRKVDDKRIVEGIKTIQDYKIIVSERSVNLAKELNNYVWTDKKGEVPIDSYNHLLDALRYYAVTVLKPKVKFIVR